METKNSKRRPKLMVVNKKAVANIGMDTVRNFSRYNRITKDAIGKRIIEMAGKVGHLGPDGVYAFDPEHVCGSVPISVRLREKFRRIIIIFVSGGIIIIEISDPFPMGPNPVASLAGMNDLKFTHSVKNGDMRTIHMERGGKMIGKIEIIADKPKVGDIHRR